MTFNTDQSSYLNYRGVSTEPLDLDILILLYKVAAAIEANSFPDTGFATIAKQDSQISELVLIKNLILGGFSDTLADLATLVSSLSNLETDTATTNTKLTDANALLTSIDTKVGATDAKESHQLQSNTLLSELVTGLSLLASENSLQAALAFLVDIYTRLGTLISGSDNLLTELNLSNTTKHDALVLEIQENKAAVETLPASIGTELETLEQKVESLDTLLENIDTKLGTSLTKLDAIATNTDNQTVEATVSLDATLTEKITLIKEQTDLFSDMVLLLNNISQTLLLARSSGGNGNLVNTPNIADLVLVNANTQYSHSFPATARRIAITARKRSGETQNLIYLSYTNGDVLDNTKAYLTLQPGEVKVIDQLFLKESLTVYFASPTAGSVVSLEWWYIAA